MAGELGALVHSNFGIFIGYSTVGAAMLTQVTDVTGMDDEVQSWRGVALRMCVAGTPPLLTALSVVTDRFPIKPTAPTMPTAWLFAQLGILISLNLDITI